MAGAYPTIKEIFDLSRVLLNDAFKGATGAWGEGRVFTDDWTPNLTILNSAIDDYQRDLELGGVPSLRKEAIFTNLPVVNGPGGSAVPDPKVIQRFGFDGFDDGSGVVNPSFQLPSDLLVPLEIHQRNTGANLTFSPVMPAPGMIESRYQDFTLGAWEWRGDSIYWNGALVAKDVRIRYHATAARIALTLLPSLFSTTTVPLLDSYNPLAYRVAYIFASGRAGEAAASGLLAHYKEATNRIVARYVRGKQNVTYEKQPFGETGDLWGWMH